MCRYVYSVYSFRKCCLIMHSIDLQTEILKKPYITIRNLFKTVHTKPSSISLRNGIY